MHQYYDLVDLQATLRGLCNDLEIPFQSAMLKYADFFMSLYKVEIPPPQLKTKRGGRNKNEFIIKAKFVHLYKVKNTMLVDG